MADRNAYTQPQVGNQGFSRTKKVLGGPIALLTTDLAINRTVALMVVPKGFVLTSYNCIVPDMDSNGSPTLVFTLGDAASSNRIATVATTGQAGGTLSTLAAAGLNYEFTADTEIIWTTTTAAATAVAGTIELRLEGYMK